MNKVILYARVSTAHHDQNPEVQLHDLRKYCENRGWIVYREIVDHGYSGGTDKRPGLQDLLKAVRQGEADCICVMKLDRLFRSLSQLIHTLDDLSARGVAFVAVRDAVDYTTSTGKMFTQILGSLAEFEKSMIRERTIAGLKFARDVKGKRLGRPKQNRNTDLITHLTSQGLSTRQVAKLVGCSPATVSRELRAVANRSAQTLTNRFLNGGI